MAHYLAVCTGMGRSRVGFGSNTCWRSSRIAQSAKSCSFHQLRPNDLQQRGG